MGRSTRLWLLGALGACNFTHGIVPGDGNAPGGGSDGPANVFLDAPLSTLDGCKSFSSQVDTCGIGGATGITVNGDQRYDTGTHQLSDSDGQNQVDLPHIVVTIGGHPVDLIVATSFTISGGAVLRVVGPNGFGVVATGDITVKGTLDASAGGAGTRSAASCGALAGRVPSDDGGGAPGGGGGGGGGMGGTGGRGDSQSPTNGGAAGASVAFPGAPLGGCPGGNGGDTLMSVHGSGGAGGGVIDLISATAIDVDGGINAGGGGGGAGRTTDGGGGGGGSGGMIIVEAPILSGDGMASANGGGGGGAAGTPGQQQASAGTPGQLGGNLASGGGASDSGTAGASGGAAGTPDGASVTNLASGGGGGGGGGVGFIHPIGASPTFDLSPPAS